MSNYRIPAFMWEKGSFAFVRELRENVDVFLLVPATRTNGHITIRADEEIYISLGELVALCAEIGTRNDREHDTENTTVVALELAEESTLLAHNRVMSQWLVRVGASPLAGHNECWENLSTDYESKGDDQFPGERRLLQLIQSGFPGVRVCAGDKQICFDQTRQGFYFRGNCTFWTAEELVVLTTIVLSDELLRGSHPHQYGPFLVESLRPHRGQLPAEVLDALGRLENGEQIGTFLPASESATVQLARQAASGSPTATDNQGPGPILQKVLNAGEAARPGADDNSKGFPAARSGLASLLSSTELQLPSS